MRQLAGRLIHLFFGKIAKQRTTQFDELADRIGPGDVVFLGDSITEGGHWSEWFPEEITRNRGIAGDTTGGVLARVCQVGSPAKVFLLIGTNDLTLGAKPDKIASNVDKILTALSQESPSTELYVESVLPRKARYAARVKSLNVEYRRLAQKHGATYIDLWPTFADDDGQLKSAYTNDTLHLVGKGYAAWTPILQPFVRPTTRGQADVD